MKRETELFPFNQIKDRRFKELFMKRFQEEQICLVT